MIVKVQRPLSTGDVSHPWLIYDEHRAHQVQIPEVFMPPSVKRFMDQKALNKAFFNARWHEGTGWTIMEPVRNQPW